MPSESTYKGHIFTITAHKFYDQNFMPKTAREISYFKRSQWARCKGKNDILHYLSSHVDKEQNNSSLLGEKDIEKFSGFFNEKELLTKKEKNALKEVLQNTDATIYTAIFSFSNETNVKCTNSKMAREIIQNTFKDFLKKAKLDPNNVEWFGCIHSNTDHLHSHIVFFEKEKQYLDSKGNLNYKTTLHPILPKDALDYYRERVGFYMTNNASYYKMRDTLLEHFGDKIKELTTREIIHKYCLQMDEFNVKQYARLTDKNKSIVNNCIDEIIKTNPSLKLLKDEYENSLQLAQEDLEMVADENNVSSSLDKIKTFKKKRLETLHNRFGNQVLDLMIMDKELNKKKSQYKTEKSSKTYYANSSKVIREKAIYLRASDYEYENTLKKLIKEIGESDTWDFKYKDIADMVEADNS